MICDPRCDLSWKMFFVHLRIKSILLHLDGMSWRYQLGLSGIMCHLRFVFPCFLFWWFVRWCKWGVKVLYCYCATVDFPFCLLMFALSAEVFQCWMYKYLQSLCLLGLSLRSSCSSFLISCNILHFKVCFFWHKNCYSSFLLISICMEYLLPSFTFNLYASLGLK